MTDFPQSTKWVPLRDVLLILNDPRWSWTRNASCKYVNLRIDTRDMACVVCDRDDHPITLKELARQLDTYLD